jgi:hypothetical protein
MGNGSYSSTARSVRADSLGYSYKSAREIFTERSMNNAMNPNGVDIRESRDSDEHPESVAIILGLDVTGSMGSIPHYLVKEGLPHIMENIINDGVKDPQLLFLGIGDHECDRAPLQVGQFESSDELLDHWLTTVFLEGGGGGNQGESYHLAWYFAGHHTSIDCFEKRNKKGFLFTIGDEPVLHDLPMRAVKDIMGVPQAQGYSQLELLDKAREMYNVYHLHLKQGSNGRSERVMNGWKQLMGDNLIIIDRKEDVSSVIAEIVTTNYQSGNDFIQESEVEIDDEPLMGNVPTSPTPSPDDEMML